jgi:hypothetical protein
MSQSEAKISSQTSQSVSDAASVAEPSLGRNAPLFGRTPKPRSGALNTPSSGNVSPVRRTPTRVSFAQNVGRERDVSPPSEESSSPSRGLEENKISSGSYRRTGSSPVRMESSPVRTGNFEQRRRVASVSPDRTAYRSRSPVVEEVSSRRGNRFGTSARTAYKDRSSVEREERGPPITNNVTTSDTNNVSEVELSSLREEQESFAAEAKSIEQDSESTRLAAMAALIKPVAMTSGLYEPRNDGKTVYVLVRILCNKKLDTIVDWFNSMTTKYDGPIDIGDMYAVGSIRVHHTKKDIENYEDIFNRYVESKDISYAAIHPEIWAVLDNTEHPTPYVNKDYYSDNVPFIQRYIFKRETRDFPDAESTFHLHCAFKDPSLIPVEESMRQMHLKMQNMIECGYVVPGTYTIFNPVSTREAYGESRLRCVIVFDEEVGDINRAHVKVLLDETNFRGKVDPSTVTQEDPEGKRIPHICVIAWLKKKNEGEFTSRYRFNLERSRRREERSSHRDASATTTFERNSPRVVSRNRGTSTNPRERSTPSVSRGVSTNPRERTTPSANRGTSTNPRERSTPSDRGASFNRGKSPYQDRRRT